MAIVYLMVVAVAVVGSDGKIYSETIIRQDAHHKIVKGSFFGF